MDMKKFKYLYNYLKMMKYTLIMGLVLTVVLVSGCGNTTGETTKEITKYVCPDGRTVLDSSSCLKLDCSTCPVKMETKTVKEPIYVCPDLTEVKDKKDCINADSEGWYDVITLHGSGQTTTQKFHITGNEWRYSVKCDLSTAGYNIVIYDKNSKHITMNLMVPCNDQFEEYSYVYQGDNDFYFDIYATNWEVKVKAKK